MTGGALNPWHARGWDSGEVDPATWEPGDPLWSRQNHGHSLYFFNFRDDTENPVCCCVDAASWPEPGCHKIPTPFDDEDEIARLVRLIREDVPYTVGEEGPRVHVPLVPVMGNLLPAPARYLGTTS